MSADDGDQTAAVHRGAGELPAGVFRRLVDESAYTFVVIDRAGTLVYVGGLAQDALGWTPEAALGRNMTEFLTPDGIAAATEVLAEIDDDDRGASGVPMVFEILQPDGSSAWAEIGAIPLLDVPGVEGIALRCRPWGGQRLLEDFLDALLADAPLAEVLSRLCGAIAASLQASGATVHHGFDGQVFASATGSGVPGDCLVHEGPWRDVLANESGIADLLVDELPDGLAELARAAGFEACWTARIPASEGLAGAALTVWRPVGTRMLASHRQVLARSLTYVRLALTRHAEHQRLRHLAGHDALTGVANRRQFRSRLAEALAIGERDLAVAFCDLDGFKVVNDTFGHISGDSALVDVAARLRSSLRTGDELARMGGDEFTVLLRNVVDAAAANHVVDRLLDAMRKPFVVEGTEVALGISIGVALAGTDATADALLARADEALYAVKRAGGGAAMVVGSTS
ncbi:MAG: sensor domain-containing diguanylate cyclase [Acidimicrobiales bacterium]